MAKILTITFNPCIDKNTQIDKLLPEKKLRCDPPTFGPGGGGINVSRALHCLGASSVAVYPAGGHTGNFLNQLMQQAGIETKSVQTSSFTRENLIVVETSTGKQFRFGMPGNEIASENCEQLLEIATSSHADFMVVSGSLLPGMPTDIIAHVAEIAKRNNSRLVLDTSGEALRKVAEVGVYLLKPNLNELASLTGKETISVAEVNDAGSEVVKNGLCEILVISMGEKGARLITRDMILEMASPQVEPVSTLGAGDSMVAGMVYALSKNFDLETVLKYGIACGTAATLTPGSELCRKDDVDALLARMDEMNGSQQAEN